MIPAWALAAFLAAVSAVPGQMTLHEHGRTGTIIATQTNGVTDVTLTADDPDGPSGQCTETWVDIIPEFRHKPHYNPAVFVNCTGVPTKIEGLFHESRSVVAMRTAICEVPNTAGPIVRNTKNCLNGAHIGLQSGKSYAQIAVHDNSTPEGVLVYHA